MENEKKATAKRQIKRKAPAKKTTAKKATAAKKATPAIKSKAATGTKRYAHWDLGLSPYHVHGFRSRTGKLLTVAALVAAGFATFTKTKGIGAAKTNGNAKLLRALIGSTPYSYHKRGHRIDGSDKLTAAGREWFGARIANDEDAQIVADAIQGFTKGGKFDSIPGVEFKREVQA